MITNILYKGSALRAADAARYARARQGRMQLKTCKGGRKKRPMIWCEQRFDNAKSCLCRANCPVVLSCAVRLLPVLRSDRQYGGTIAWGKNRGTVRDQIHVEKEKKRKVVHNNTYYTRYCSMFERKHTAHNSCWWLASWTKTEQQTIRDKKTKKMMERKLKKSRNQRKGGKVQEVIEGGVEMGSWERPGRRQSRPRRKK